MACGSMMGRGPHALPTTNMMGLSRPWGKCLVGGGRGWENGDGIGGKTRNKNSRLFKQKIKHMFNLIIYTLVIAKFCSCMMIILCVLF